MINTAKFYYGATALGHTNTVCEITFETWLIHCQDIIKFARTQVKLSAHHVKLIELFAL